MYNLIHNADVAKPIIQYVMRNSRRGITIVHAAKIVHSIIVQDIHRRSRIDLMIAGFVYHFYCCVTVFFMAAVHFLLVQQ